MGLIKVAAAIGAVHVTRDAIKAAVKGTVASQWKEFFYCDALNAEILVVKGRKRTSARYMNDKEDDNIISAGSYISVADGQCMLIVENGQVCELCAEAGIYKYDSDLTSSVFSGDLLDGVDDFAQEMWNRFTFGGNSGKDQRVYYINTKEIIGNKYGTSHPIPFRIVDNNIGLDIDVSVRCHGEYTYKIVNPMLFYENVCGNVAESYKRSQIEATMKSELLTALQPAFARISEKGIRYSALPGHTAELAEVLNEVLSEKWMQIRGIRIVAVGVNSVFISKEDEEMLKQLQKTAVMRNPQMAAAGFADAQADAMRAAARNENGAVAGIMGMDMVNRIHTVPSENIHLDNQKTTWACIACGTLNTGKFCMECGRKRPMKVEENKCRKCGWMPEHLERKPKYCPECGEKFDV